MTVFAGFFGKIPARGDFVRSGIPGSTVAALDAWCQEVLPGSRSVLGDGWTAAWMEAPIWRFLLPPGQCGPGTVAGLWLPSTDRAGRLFPLFILLCAPVWRDLAPFGLFLDGAEQAGLAALEHDLPPDRLANAVSAAVRPGGTPWPEPQHGVWWTAGSDRVAPARHILPTMPSGTDFAAMLQDPPAG